MNEIHEHADRDRSDIKVSKLFQSGRNGYWSRSLSDGREMGLDDMAMAEVAIGHSGFGRNGYGRSGYFVYRWEWTK